MGFNEPLQESDLLFSPAASSLKFALGELKRSNLSIKNRLHSIKLDAAFVQRVSATYRLPLVANERCGSWYIAPEHKHGSAYFKSTDGHFGQWAFSLRRLNLQIFDILDKHQGCIIVDSTRRGKSIPDALSKTVPIWCAVLNALLFPHDAALSELRTPEDVVSPSEHAQIEQRLDGFVKLAQELNLDLDGLRAKLHRTPLQVTWIRPNEVPELVSDDPRRGNLIVLCTSSSRDSSERNSHDYVQGAADDSESWACGLTSRIFWTHHDTLLAASEDELPGLIESLIASDRSHTSSRPPNLVRPTANLWIGDCAMLRSSKDDYDVIVVCAAQSLDIALGPSHRLVHLACTTGKLGSRKLRTELQKIDVLAKNLYSDMRILVACESGRDIAVGASLALLCKFFDQNGTLVGGDNEQGANMNKTIIKQRLSWIMVSMPDATPSRATLQSVNAYLMR